MFISESDISLKKPVVHKFITPDRSDSTVYVCGDGINSLRACKDFVCVNANCANNGNCCCYQLIDCNANCTLENSQLAKNQVSLKCQSYLNIVNPLQVNTIKIDKDVSDRNGAIHQRYQ